MFGYVRPPLGLLPKEETERFRRAYCGLCHTLGRRYGTAARFILNYDFTYLAILLSDGTESERREARCLASPVKKHPYLHGTAALELAADESIILAYWQLRDGVADHDWLHGVKYRSLSVILEPAYRKAAAARPGFDHRTRKQLDLLGELDWKSISGKALALAQNWGSGLLSSGGGLIGGVVSGVSTFVIGLIFSFYILLQKEKLARQGRQVLYGLLPQKQADRTLEVLRLAERTFSSFLSGQCLEAVILGTLFVISMTLLRMPYALLVGVLIALTALIPIVGAFIGCGVGTLLIAVTDPWKALMFVVLFLVLQQIEGNLIYPHVVGSSVGLPSIWVLAAVTLGGKLMGVGGMLFFIPLCSVLYALFRDFVKGRLADKKVPARKWRDPPSGKQR